MEDIGQSLREGLGTLGSMSVKGFDRAKQFSQEKMGNAVKTEYDQVSFSSLSLIWSRELIPNLFLGDPL